MTCARFRHSFDDCTHRAFIGLLPLSADFQTLVRLSYRSQAAFSSTCVKKTTSSGTAVARSTPTRNYAKSPDIISKRRTAAAKRQSPAIGSILDAKSAKGTLDEEDESQQLWAEKEAKKALQRLERKVKTEEEAMRRMGDLTLEVDGKVRGAVRLSWVCGTDRCNQRSSRSTPTPRKAVMAH